MSLHPGVCIVLAFAVSGCPDSSTPPNFGRFEPEEPCIQLNKDGRTAKLLSDFSFIDPAGKTWAARSDAVVDGASIPRPCWSFFGGPWDGPYRNASIVHDYYCDHGVLGELEESSADVHKMFFFACLAGGVDATTAAKMYWAVDWFGPRWSAKATAPLPASIAIERSRPFAVSIDEFDEQLLAALDKYIEKAKPTIDDLHRLSPQELRKKAAELK